MTSKEKAKQAEDTIERIADGAHSAVDSIAGATSNAADNLQAKGKQLHATQEEWSNQVRDYVRENPMTTLALAAASGYIASRILGSR